MPTWRSAAMPSDSTSTFLVTVPSGLVTSKCIQVCGLIQSILVSTALVSMFELMSTLACTAWCANAGAEKAIRHAPPAPANASFTCMDSFLSLLHFRSSEMHSHKQIALLD